MLFFREGLKKWYFFMTFDIKGGGGGPRLPICFLRPQKQVFFWSKNTVLSPVKCFFQNEKWKKVPLRGVRGGGA